MKNESNFSVYQVSISGFNEKYIDGKTVTFYKICIHETYSNKTWEVEKRYSEIEHLHKEISKLSPNIPPIPGKTLFRITDKNDLEKRKIKLEKFLQECINRKDIVTNNTFIRFLELYKNSPDLNAIRPEIVYENNELPLGVRDFYFYEEESILFIVCSDMDIKSRVNSYVNNTNISWEEKKKTDFLSLGAAFAYKVIKNKKKEPYRFEKLWGKSFTEQTGVVNFDKEKFLLQIGLDSGKIIFYKTTSESRFLEYEELYNFQPHLDRVMGLAYNPNQECIYSCSTDKFFYLTKISDLNKSIEIHLSGYGYTNLFFDKKRQCVFLTNEGGELSIYSTKINPLGKINVIQTHSINCIRALEIDFVKQFMFTGTTQGDISIIDLGPPGKEKLATEVSYLCSDLEIRILKYDINYRELFSGDQKGKITVWSCKTGKPVYAWQAHNGAITQMRYDVNKRQLLSAGKDKKFIYWQIPKSWVSESAKKFEEENIQKEKESKAKERFEKQLSKENDGDDSSSDSLDGWDVRE